jgi:lysozyme
MRTNQKGIAIIKEFEGCKLHAYLCPADKLTIGYGHTGDVVEGMTITQHQAEQLLEYDIEHLESVIAPHIKQILSDNQFSALVSFAFNVGPYNLIRNQHQSPSTLLILINEGDFAGAAQQFMRWVYVDNRVSDGLIRRRKAEQSLFEEE